MLRTPSVATGWNFSTKIEQMIFIRFAIDFYWSESSFCTSVFFSVMWGWLYLPQRLCVDKSLKNVGISRRPRNLWKKLQVEFVLYIIKVNKAERWTRWQMITSWRSCGYIYFLSHEPLHVMYFCETIGKEHVFQFWQKGKYKPVHYFEENPFPSVFG